MTGAGPAELRVIRRQIGMIFQQFNLVRRASVLDNVLAGRLGFVPPLPSLLGRFPPSRPRPGARVPGPGRARRTWPAGAPTRCRAASSSAWPSRARWPRQPAVILADEPTASLDPALTTEIMDILRRINVERGLTLVVSQHQLETALAYATRVVGFRAGRVSFDGPPAAVTPAAVRGDLRRRGAAVKRAAVFVGLVVFAWLVWDTGADPARLARGLPVDPRLPPAHDAARLPRAPLGAGRRAHHGGDRAARHRGGRRAGAAAGLPLRPQRGGAARSSIRRAPC